MNKTGWVEINSSQDRIVGILSFTNSASTYLASYELSSKPLSHFVFPLISADSSYDTGIALLNFTAQPANVRLELWGPSGTLDQTASIKMGSFSSMAKLVEEVFPGMQAHQTGNVRVSSDQPLYGLGALFDRSLRFMSNVQPVAFPGQ